MPRIKSLREDILRPIEVQDFLARAKNHTVQALIAFLYGYGNRISEILILRPRDIQLSEKWIQVTFTILKKKPRSGIKPVKKKKLSRTHYLAPYILGHLELIPEASPWIFPSYRHPEKHLSRITAYRWLKEVDQDIWPHLFRHSLATIMAEHGATAFELVAWFAWDSLATARKYVRDTQILSTKWSKRDF